MIIYYSGNRDPVHPEDIGPVGVMLAYHEPSVALTIRRLKRILKQRKKNDKRKSKP